MSAIEDQRAAALQARSRAITWPPHDSSRLRTRVLAIAEHGHAIDDDVLHTDRGDTIATNADIRAPTRRAGAILERAVADDEVVSIGSLR